MSEDAAKDLKETIDQLRLLLKAETENVVKAEKRVNRTIEILNAQILLSDYKSKRIKEMREENERLLKENEELRQKVWQYEREDTTKGTDEPTTVSQDDTAEHRKSPC